MRCEQTANQLADLAAGRIELDPPARLHVDSCLRCQAEIVQYRKLLRELRTLRHDVVAPPSELLASIYDRLEAAEGRAGRRALLSARRVAYVGGIAAATAGAAGAIVLASLSRRGRLAS